MFFGSFGINNLRKESGIQARRDSRSARAEGPISEAGVASRAAAPLQQVLSTRQGTGGQGRAR